MTKAEVLAKLNEKLIANRKEVQRQIEVIADLPGHSITLDGEDLFQKLSTTWKEGQKTVEIANELVTLVWHEDPKPEAVPQVLQ